MSIRESLAYSKDLITGRKKEVLKNKENNMIAKGVFTVELFDSQTGEKTYEAKSENRISAVLANPAYLDGYLYRMLDNKIKNHWYEALSGYGPCNVLTLTDGDIPENPYDYWIWGNVIGYADLLNNYAGSNSKRGNRNASESKRIYNYENGDETVIRSITRHWVVDFPTNSGNGTFKSIYLTGSGEKENSSWYYPAYNWIYDKKVLKEGKSGTSIPIQSITTDENYIYSLQSNSNKILCWDKRTWVKQNDKTLPDSMRSFSYDKSTQTFWAINSNGTFKKYDKSFNLLQSFNISSSLDIVDGITMSKNRVFWDICVTEAYVLQTFIVNNSDSSLNKTVLAVYNKDGTFVKNIIIHDSSKNNTVVFEIPNNKIKIISYASYIILNKSDLTIYSNEHSGNKRAGWNGGSEYCMWDFDLNIVCRYDSSSYGKIVMSWVVPAGAHTLLPEPVTKTPTNTMKIQYDLTVDFVYSFDMPSK